ncbi:MAG: hypothetical protein ACLQBA_13080, partial [Candidatus Binataceae bacterium]
LGRTRRLARSAWTREPSETKERFANPSTSLALLAALRVCEFLQNRGRCAEPDALTRARDARHGEASRDSAKIHKLSG